MYRASIASGDCVSMVSYTRKTLLNIQQFGLVRILFQGSGQLNVVRKHYRYSFPSDPREPISEAKTINHLQNWTELESAQRPTETTMVWSGIW